jgi:pimeloyl-ACP methyl ester carboxylesterase
MKDDYACILFDLPGVGQSPPSGGPFSLQRLINDTIAFLNELSISRAHLVGASVGAAVVQEICLQHPQRAASATLISTWSSTQRHHATRHWLEARMHALESRQWEVYDGFSYLLIGASNLASDDPRIQAILSKRTELNPRALQAEIGHYRAALEHEADARLSAISCPTSVIYGVEDVVTVPAYNEEVATRIPHCRITAIPAAGHLARIERAEEVTAALRTFITDADGEATVVGDPK